GARLRQQVANGRRVLDDEDALAGAAGRRRRGRRGRSIAARPLTVEPGVDVALAESPLAADPHSRNLSRLNQTINSTKVDLQVLENFLGRQEHFVCREIERQDPVILPPCPAMTGSSVQTE